jgi:hypothetical protein
LNREPNTLVWVNPEIVPSSLTKQPAGLAGQKRSCRSAGYSSSLALAAPARAELPERSVGLHIIEQGIDTRGPTRCSGFGVSTCAMAFCVPLGKRERAATVLA